MNVLPPEVPDTTVETDLPSFWSINAEVQVLVQQFGVTLRRVYGMLRDLLPVGVLLSILAVVVGLVVRFLCWLF